MDKTEPSTTEILLQEAMNKIISLKRENEITSVKLEVFEKMIAFHNHAANKNIVQYAVSDAPLPVELRIERHLNELRNPPKPPMPDPAAKQTVPANPENFNRNEPALSWNLYSSLESALEAVKKQALETQPFKLTEEQYAEARKMFFEQFNNCVEYRNEELCPEQTFWMDKDRKQWVFNCSLKQPNDIYIRYEFWLIFETIFNLDENQIIGLLKNLAEEAFKKEELTPVLGRTNYLTLVEEAFYNQSESEKPE
jgi:hypothetical protein